MKQSKRSFYFLALLSSILVIGCSQTNTQTSESLSTKPPIPVVTKIPTLLPSSTPINIVDLTNLTTNCVEISDTPPTDVKLSNSLVFSSPLSESYILNLETNQRTYLEGSHLDELIVSPDMQKTAYIDYDTEKLVIFDINNNESKTFDGFNGRYRLAKWLDNENLVINKAKEERPLYYHYSLVIFDTQTSTFKEYNLEDFPNANTFKTGYSYLFPNPQTTKMVYLSFVADNSLILFDMQSEKQQTEIYFTNTIPLWTKDGKSFVISAVMNFQQYTNFVDSLPYLGGNELFFINAAGETERLTFLTTQYPNNYPSFLSWSPTEEYIAFNLQNVSQPNFGLSTLNINTGEIINYCIHDTWGYVFWSPDEKQIAFTRWDGRGSSKAEVYILDLEKNLAFKIADNTMVAGWMINKE